MYIIIFRFYYIRFCYLQIITYIRKKFTMELKKTIGAMTGSRGKSIEDLSKDIGKSSANTRITIKHNNPNKDFLKKVGEALDYDLAYVDKHSNNIFKL